MKTVRDPINLLYEKAFQENVAETQQSYVPDLRFRASEAGSCLRQIAYRVSGYRPQPVSADFNFLGMQGTVDHDITRQAFEHHGIPLKGLVFHDDGSVTETIEKYCDVTHKTPSGKVSMTVSFRSDGEIDTPLGACMLEIKGMSFYPYKYLREAYYKGGNEAAVDRIISHHPRYYWQMQVSVYLANNFLGKSYKHVYFVPKDRSFASIGVGDHKHEIDSLTGQMQIVNTRTGIYVPYDKKAALSVLDRFAVIMRRLDADGLPTPEYADGTDSCVKYCSFYYACHGAKNRETKKIEPAFIYPEVQFSE